jgi:hypothetical protein
MDSVRIEWIAECDLYNVHIPDQEDMLLSIQNLEALQDAIAKVMKDMSA